jgi:hypothetical protein
VETLEGGGFVAMRKVDEPSIRQGKQFPSPEGQRRPVLRILTEPAGHRLFQRLGARVVAHFDDVMRHGQRDRLLRQRVLRADVDLFFVG